MAKITRVEEVKTPRILTIDFDHRVEKDLRQRNFNVISGSTGFINGVFNIPVHPQNIDIVMYRINYPGFGFTKTMYQLSPTKISPLIKPIRQYPTTVIEINNFSDIGHFAEEHNKWIVIFLGRTRGKTKFLADLLGITPHLFVPKTEDYPVNFKSHSDNTEHLCDFLQAHSDNITAASALDREDILTLSTDREIILTATDEAYHFFSFLFCPVYKKRRRRLLVVPCFDYPKESELCFEILSTISGITPGIFSENYIAGRWMDDDKYKLNDALEIKQKIEKSRREFELQEKSLQEQFEKIDGDGAYHRRLLINGDDENVEEDKKLKPVVKDCLDLIGFKITDMDKTRQEEKEEPLREDLLIEDPADGFKALVEVRGTVRGPQIGNIDDLRRHLRHYSLKYSETIRGILILNYERNKDVNLRSSFYASQPAEVKKAKEDSIGLLSSQVFFEMVKALLNSGKDQQLQKKIRDLIKQVGVIKFT